MSKKIIVIFLLYVVTYAQTKLYNESIVGNKILLKYSSELNYSIKKEGSKNVLIVPGYQDESSPGNARLPSQSVFVSLPFIAKPKINFSILSSQKINAIPKFNDKVELKNKNLVYTKPKIIKDMRTKHFEVKGYLWLGNKYCLHLEITPAIFLSSQNKIEIVKEFSVELQFDKSIPQLTNLKEKVTNNNIISNSKFEIQDIKEKFKITSDDSWIDYTKNYVKIGTAEDAVYRIYKSDLEDLGVNVFSINPKSFKIILKGKEIPIYIKGENDLSFDANDYIEFVGIRNLGGHHREVSSYNQPYNEYLGRYTDTTVYWLTWNGEDGKRANISLSNEVTSNDTLNYYSQIDHYEKNKWFDFSSSNQVRRENPYWTENKTWHEGGLKVRINNKRFTVSDVVPGKTLKIFAKFQDYASDISNNAHYVTLGLNSDNWGDSVFLNKYDKVVLQNELNSDLLNNGNNNLSINSMETEALLNVCIFDWYEVEYPRYLYPVNDSLKFLFPFVQGSAVKRIKLQNVTSDNFVIWKYGNNYKKYSTEKIGSEIVFTDTVSKVDKFIYLDETKIKTPKIYYQKQFVNLRSSENQADYIAITHKNFIEKVNSYAQFIKENYQVNSKVIDIDDIYDEFSYGFFNPEAIKDFLKTTHLNWQNPKLKYVFLIGGATYDYYGYKHKNFGIKRVLNYVPSFGAPVSDNWFVTWDTTGAYIPQMNIGRIPVTTNEELEWYIEKHKNYVTQKYDDWNKRYMFFSSGNEKDENQLNLLRASNEFVIDNYVLVQPIGGKVDHFYKTLNPNSNFGPYSNEYFDHSISNGAVFISYIGHSGTQTWDNSIISPTQLMNDRDRYPLVSDFGCSTGKFAEPDVISFSQLFTLSPEGQALLYIGNSSLGFVSTSVTMPKLFYKEILKNGVNNVSQAHKEAKLNMLKFYGSTGTYGLFALTNAFIGDPIISLPIPTKPNFVLKNEDISIVNSNISDLSEKVELKIAIFNYGSVPIDTLNIKLVHSYINKADTILLKTKVPNFSSSIIIPIAIKNQPGQHSINIFLDYDSKFEEINEDDNYGQYNFYVASSKFRTLLQYENENSFNNYIKFLNPILNPNTDNIIFEYSKNKSFQEKQSVAKEFDTLVTQINLDGKLDNNRYWFRTKKVNSDLYTSTFSAVPFMNSKFLLLDSISYSNTYLHNAVISENSIKLDTTKINFHVLSAAFSDGNTVLIQKNSTNYVFDGTLRGHYVSVFMDSTYEFVDSKVFDLLGGGTSAADEYSNFLDTLNTNYLVVFAIKDEGGINLSEALREKIKTFGSTLIDSIDFRSSWTFIGKKGAIPGTMPESFSHEGEGFVTIDTTISFLTDKGSILTNEIGPAGKWSKLVVNQETPSNSTIRYFPIGIRKNGVLDTLVQLNLLKDSVANISYINSEIYPKIKLLVNFTSSDDKLSPILNSLGVDYNLIPELAINYQVVSLQKDTLQQGEDVNLSFYVYNVGESTADSFMVQVDVIKPDNSKEKIFEQLVDSLGAEERKKFNISYNTTNFNGERTFAITIDPGDKISELFEDNNFYNIPFYVLGDTTKPSMILTIDGNDIFDGEYISSTPKIKVELSDPSLIPITDTSSISIYLNNNYINYFGNEDILQVNFSATNPKVTVDYSPTLEDGEYTLRVFGKDASGNVSDSSGITKTFNIINEAKLLNVYNYPNPFSIDTYFTFKLTQIPDEIRIRIFTIAGRLIKEIELSSDQLNFDLNKIYWNGKDDDGDFLGNGVYLYKVIMDVGGKKYDVTQKMAVVR